MSIFGDPWLPPAPPMWVVQNPWQKCPVCDGAGLVTRPPWVAGDQQTWDDTQTAPYECKVCKGKGIIR